MKSIDEVVDFADAVKGYMYRNELRWLCETARSFKSPAEWCEIGSWQGRSATAVVGGLPLGSRLHLVDNFSGPTTREMPNKKACRQRLEFAIEQMRAFAPGIAISLTVGDSAVAAGRFRDRTIDVVFIDGDHKYETVLADIHAWRPLMKPGGLMCGHDFTNKCGVEPAVRELFPTFGQVPDSSLWFARV